jgi:hypothetical protein
MLLVQFVSLQGKKKWGEGGGYSEKTKKGYSPSLSPPFHSLSRSLPLPSLPLSSPSLSPLFLSLLLFFPLLSLLSLPSSLSPSSPSPPLLLPPLPLPLLSHTHSLAHTRPLGEKDNLIAETPNSL